MATDPAHVPLPTEDDLRRLRQLTSSIGGPEVTWGAQSLLDVWATEHRIRADAEAARRLQLATVVLAVSTVVFAFATIGLRVATVTTSR